MNVCFAVMTLGSGITSDAAVLPVVIALDAAVPPLVIGLPKENVGGRRRLSRGSG
jgi:hypothetical protein